ncbi:hypothetical protein TNCV_3732991 [Trichonephila clavipes]|nr:hypothetical protein TNCV_3732991 [Trichonephila clavipes]
MLFSAALSVEWLVTLTAVPYGLGWNPGEGMDVCKCIVSLQHWVTLNNRRTAGPFVRWVEGKERIRWPSLPCKFKASLSLIVRSTVFDSSEVKKGLRCSCKMHVWVSGLTKMPTAVDVRRSDVTALALSYRTFPLRKV